MHTSDGSRARLWLLQSTMTLRSPTLRASGGLLVVATIHLVMAGQLATVVASSHVLCVATPSVRCCTRCGVVQCTRT